MNVTLPSRSPSAGETASDEHAPATAQAASDPDADADQPPEPEPARRRPRADAATVELLVRCANAAGLDHRWIRTRLAAAAGQLPDAVARLDVSIVDDEQMTRLHREHCGIDETTDVLTFVGAEPPEAIEADIAVCADEARRRAGGAAGAVERELLLYCVHGLLHAAGFDDREPAAFAAMHAREDEILEAIGVGPVFRGDPSGHDDDRRRVSRDDGSKSR